LKKSIVILLSFLVLLSTTGFSITIKHCPRTQKTSVSFDFRKTCCSEKCKKCCSKKQVVFKKIKDTAFEKNEIKISQNTAYFISSTPFSSVSSENTLTEFSNTTQSSDLVSKISFSILYRSILI